MADRLDSGHTPLRSSLSHKAMASHRTLAPQRSMTLQRSMSSHSQYGDPDDSINRILEGPLKFSLPDTSQQTTTMQKQYSEKDFQSHRNESLHVHHPLGALSRKSSKASLASLKHGHASTPGPMEASLPSSSSVEKQPRKSVPNLPSSGLTRPTDLQLGPSLSVPKISVTNADEQEKPKKKAMFIIGADDDDEIDSSVSDMQQPASHMQQPATNTQQPATNTQQPATKQQPATDVPKPTSDAQQPTSDAQQPPTDVQHHIKKERLSRKNASASHGYHKHHHHKKPRHHHHHHHHKDHLTEDDLQARKRIGSHIALEDLASTGQIPTEPEEAANLNLVDLEGIAEHRFGVVHKRHKPKTKTRDRVNSIIHVARSRHSSAASWASDIEAELKLAELRQQLSASEGKKKKVYKKKSVQFKRQYDHRPHEVFVELDELFKEEGHELQWKEKARWIKFEEDVEEGVDRWGKPHVASLTFHSLVELRKLLEHGSVLLDLEEWELNEIFHRVTENLITSDQVSEDHRGEVLRALLIKHKHVEEQKPFLRNVSSLSLKSMARTPSDGNFKHGFFKGLTTPTTHEKLFRKTSSENYTPIPEVEGEINGNMSNNASKDDVRIVITEIEDPPVTNGSASPEKPRKKGIGAMIPTDLLSPTAHRVALPTPTKSHSFAAFGQDDRNGKNELGKQRHTDPDLFKDLVTQQPQPHPKSAKQKLDGIMRKIPKDAEATTVLVGELPALERPALCFVRLAEGTILNGLTEVPIPVRFLFILLGPGGDKVDYHEIGRCFSTLMSNEHFHEIAYKADNMDDILSAMNEFIDDSMVLPAGNWDKDLLLPILRVQNQKMKQRYKKAAGIKEEEEEELLGDQTDGAVKIKKAKKAKFIDPLVRTGRPFGGLINDMKRRYPHFISDFRDAFNTQCLATIFFLFFAALSPVITFGGVLSEGTDNYMGVSEMILGSAICGILFAFFSGQPITIIGVTGPILVFENTLYLFCKSNEIDYLPFRFWVGFWLFLITMVTIAVEASVLVRYFTRFTEEVFSFLIAVLFLKEVFKKFHKIFIYHPLKVDYCYDKYSQDGYYTSPMYPSNTSEWEEVTVIESVFEMVTDVMADVTMGTAMGKAIPLEANTTDLYNMTDLYNTTAPSDYKCTARPKPKKYQPNTALLSTILMLGTFCLAWFFKRLKSSKFLGKKGRQMIGDFGTSIAIMIMVGLDIIIDTVYTEKIYIPDGFNPTDSCKRGWVVNPLGTDSPLSIWWIFAAAIPGFLAFILMFMETLIDGLIVDNPKNKLKKGSGFHLDLFVLGFLAMLNGLLGLPWVWAATVRSVTHLHSLCVWSKSHAPGEKPRLLRVREQRVTALVVNVLVGICILIAPLLNKIPVSVLFGVFLYMGVSSLNGIQMVERFVLLAMPSKHHPDAQFVRGVRTWRMHVYTLIQLACVVILGIIKSTKAAISFPFFLMLLVPVRLLLNRVFTIKELVALDSHENEDDDEDEFHEAHMPV